MKTYAMAVTAAGLLAVGGALAGYAYGKYQGVSSTAPVSRDVVHDTVTVTDTVEEYRSEIPVVAVHFAPGSVALPQSEKESLDLILRAAKVHSQMCLILDGYSDTTGGAATDNDNLSSRRTFTLYRFLLDNGIQRERMYMRSFGASKSGADAGQSVRRVDVSLSEVFR